MVIIICSLCWTDMCYSNEVQLHAYRISFSLGRISFLCIFIIILLLISMVSSCKEQRNNMFLMQLFQRKQLCIEKSKETIYFSCNCCTKYNCALGRAKEQLVFMQLLHRSSSFQTGKEKLVTNVNVAESSCISKRTILIFSHVIVAVRSFTYQKSLVPIEGSWC